MPEFEIEVSFEAKPVTVVVEADSIGDVWKRRHELVRGAQPTSWEIKPYSVVPTTGWAVGERT